MKAQEKHEKMDFSEHCYNEDKSRKKWITQNNVDEALAVDYSSYDLFFCDH